VHREGLLQGFDFIEQALDVRSPFRKGTSLIMGHTGTKEGDSDKDTSWCLIEFEGELATTLGLGFRSEALVQTAEVALAVEKMAGSVFAEGQFEIMGTTP
jgi:hypothetical protein